MPIGKIPSLEEHVVATVKKIMPYGAFCSLDEYPGTDAFIHVSQVSAGWVRNIREHLREGQKIVAKVSVVDLAKGQIDLSVKQVGESDRRRKLESYQAEKKARKLVEVAGAKLGRKPDQSMREVGDVLASAYGGSVADAIDALAQGALSVKLPPEWAAALTEIVEKEVKVKSVEVRARLTLKFLDGDGVGKLRDALAAAEQVSVPGVKVEVKYLGAPHYYVDAVGDDFKAAEKVLEKVQSAIEKRIDGGSAQFEFEVLRK
ncbi:translation initiation factor IF-2 subunit alpha [Candidatus Micrarchaeota archaeon]|nr:translation initiation factor IF-2 subunit alpha [Candidatus Micrarchaeota archaeon]MBI5177536.1 translation initiation factor IF-2 subunit alpha [Candidatus Micrarchaeota archaeon]